MVRELIKMSFLVVTIFVFNAIATNTITLPTYNKSKIKRVTKHTNKLYKAPKISLIDYRKTILESFSK